MATRNTLGDMHQYAVYDDDDFVALGTADELADLLGVKRATILFMCTPTAHKRNKRVAIRVDESDGGKE